MVLFQVSWMYVMWNMSALKGFRIFPFTYRLVYILMLLGCNSVYAEEIIPRKYGWVPGVLNMQAAQGVIDEALSTGYPVAFEAGEYLVDVTGPARELDGKTFYVNSVYDRALYATKEGATLVLLGSSAGQTTIKMAGVNRNAAILFAEHLDRLEIENLSFDGNINKDVGRSGLIASFGVYENYIFNSKFFRGGATRIGSSERRRAKLLSHGNNYFEDIFAAFSIGIKHWGVERVIETAPNTYVRAGGGATYDGDPIYYPGRPVLEGIVADGNSLTLMFEDEHNYLVGDWIEIRGADDIFFNGRFKIISIPDLKAVGVNTIFPPSAGSAVGNLDSTKAWPPTEYIEVYQAITEDMYSPGQVNAIKIEDGANEVYIHIIDANNHVAGNQKATGIFIGAGSANLGYRKIHIDNVSGKNLSNVVQIGLGGADIEKMTINSIYGDDVASLLNVHLIDSRYKERHGVIKKLTIGSMIGGELRSPYNNKGSVLDIGSRWGGQGLIQSMTIGSYSFDFVAQKPFVMFDSAVDKIFGGRDDDVLFGSDGNEVIVGGGANDLLFGLNGDDILRGGGGDDALEGLGGDDQLFGKSGRDVLDGGAGNDVLSGGKGDDFLRGGKGSDIFKFTARDGRDNIGDFDVNFDLLDLSRVGYIANYRDLLENHLFEADDCSAIIASTIEDIDLNRIKLTGVCKINFDRVQIVLP
jgi:hypothetical protein